MGMRAWNKVENYGASRYLRIGAISSIHLSGKAVKD
jgi:hypothetical protein